MIQPHRATRTASVRVVVVFGLAAFLLLLLVSGIFYRYFAYRWWYDPVVRTTPSVAHLYELYRLQGFMGFGITPQVFVRLQDDPILCERFQQELLRRFIRLEDPEIDGRAIMRAVLYLSENDRHSVDEMRRLWAALVEGCRSLRPERRTAAGLVLNALSDSKAIEDPGPGLWLAYSMLHDEPEQLSPSIFGTRLADALAEAVATRTDSRVMQWAIALPDESDSHTFLEQTLCGRIKRNPNENDIQTIMEAVAENPSAMGRLLCSAVAERPDCAGLCLDASIREPHLAAAVWSGLSKQASSPAVSDAIAQRWDRLEPMLKSDFGEWYACSVVKTLLATGDLDYLPWIRAQAAHGGGIRGRDAILALAEHGVPADAELLMPRLFDPDTRRIAGWSIRRLDGARILATLIEGLWTDIEPLSRLEAISAVSEDDPFANILRDPRLHGLDRNEPLYQALLVIGLTQEQQQLLEAAVSGSDP